MMRVYSDSYSSIRWITVRSENPLGKNWVNSCPLSALPPCGGDDVLEVDPGRQRRVLGEARPLVDEFAGGRQAPDRVSLLIDVVDDAVVPLLHRRLVEGEADRADELADRALDLDVEDRLEPRQADRDHRSDDRDDDQDLQQRESAAGALGSEPAHRFRTTRFGCPNRARQPLMSSPVLNCPSSPAEKIWNMIPLETYPYGVPHGSTGTTPSFR